MLLANPKLNYVDEILITPFERIDTYALFNTQENTEIYRFRLGIALQIVSVPRILHPDFLEPSKNAFDVANVTSLTRFNSFGLVLCNFSKFSALKELNLRDNKLTDITALGLKGLPNLQKLDVSKNLIRNPIPYIAQFIDTLPELQILAIRENPAIKSAEDRLKLIGFIPSMKQICPVLTVVDTQVTIREKIEGLIQYGSVSPSEGEDLRLQSIVAQKVLVGAKSEEVTKLDLSFCGLKGKKPLFLRDFFFFTLLFHLISCWSCEIQEFESIDVERKLYFRIDGVARDRISESSGSFGFER